MSATSPCPVPGEIKVLLVDSRILVREGLRALIGQHPDFAVVGVTSSIRGSRRTAPDVVVADIVPDGEPAVDVVAGLREECPDAALLVLTPVDEPAAVRRTLAAGASGYLLQTAAVSDFFLALRCVARGETHLQPSLAAALARQPSPGAGYEGTVERLTAREVEVLRLLALGHTNSEIAALREVSLRTVEAQRARILQKLDRHTRAELVRFAIDQGIVDLSPNLSRRSQSYVGRAYGLTVPASIPPSMMNSEPVQ